MSESIDPQTLARARAALAAARAVAVLTGAGISAESGIPTFRDAMTGMWARFRAEDLATPEAFLRNPRTVWEWYAERREKVESVAPNAGHLALAALEEACARRGAEFTLITQNVDGLHHAAGSRQVHELHGNIRRVKCFDQPPEEALERAFQCASQCDVFLSVGTSGLVEPAASLALIAMESGATVIEVNPVSTPLSARAAVALAGPAGAILPRLVQ